MLLARLGLAVVPNGVGCGSISRLFQRSASVFVGSFDGERGDAGLRRRDDLREFTHNGDEFLGTIWDWLVSRSVASAGLERRTSALLACFPQRRSQLDTGHDLPSVASLVELSS